LFLSNYLRQVSFSSFDIFWFKTKNTEGTNFVASPPFFIANVSFTMELVATTGVLFQLSSKELSKTLKTMAPWTLPFLIAAA